MQIQAFFEQNAPVTQAQCNTEAGRITGEPVKPTAVQSGCSYTVVTESGSLVVQFRCNDSALDLGFLKDIEQAYEGFVPHHESVGKVGKVHVYRMNNVGGVAMYLARDQLHANDCLLLKQTLQDYARSVGTPNLKLQGAVQQIFADAGSSARHGGTRLRQ